MMVYTNSILSYIRLIQAKHTLSVMKSKMMCVEIICIVNMMLRISY